MAGDIDIPDEIVTAAAEAIEDEAIRRIGRDLGTLHRDDIVRAGLAAAVPLLRARWEAEQRDPCADGCRVEIRRCLAETRPVEPVEPGRPDDIEALRARLFGGDRLVGFERTEQAGGGDE